MTCNQNCEQGAEQWKHRVIDALICGHIYTAAHDSDPKTALADLIAWENVIALDPKVSDAAAKLVTEAERAGMERAIAACEKLRSSGENKDKWTITRDMAFHECMQTIRALMKGADRG